MKLGLRARLLGLALGVVVVSAVLVNVEVRPQLEAHLMGNLEREVAGRAQLVAALAEAQRPSALDAGALQRLARALAVDAQGPVELLGADGVPLASSELTQPSLSRARDADFVAARAARRGQAVPGFLVEGRNLYSAAGFRLADGSEAVARVSQSLLAMDQALAEFRALLLAACPH